MLTCKAIGYARECHYVEHKNKLLPERQDAMPSFSGFGILH